MPRPQAVHPPRWLWGRRTTPAPVLRPQNATGNLVVGTRCFAPLDRVVSVPRRGGLVIRSEPPEAAWRQRQQPHAAHPQHERTCAMFRSLSASLLWRGLLAVAIGIVAILWPRRHGPCGGRHLRGRRLHRRGAPGPAAPSPAKGAGPPLRAISCSASSTSPPAVVAIAWPGITALALTIWIGAWGRRHRRRPSSPWPSPRTRPPGSVPLYGFRRVCSP